MSTNPLLPRKEIWAVFLFGLLVGTDGFSESKILGLDISVSADIIATAGEATAEPPDRVQVRVAELTLSSPADYLFDGTVSIAGHQENGAAYFELHEAFIGSSKLIPRSRIRMGQFFLGIGRLSQIHYHDWPFISSPEIQTRIFGGEGFIDTGVEYGILLPLPFYLDLKAGLVSGYTLGHSHTQGTKPIVPTHYFRLESYTDVVHEGGLQVGMNYLGRTSRDQEKVLIVGGDVVGKWRRDRTLRALFQAEFWYRRLSSPGVSADELLGGYLFPQYGFDPHWSLGLRMDFATNLSLEDAAASWISNLDYLLVPTLTYKPSEFTTFRTGVSLGADYRDDQGSRFQWAFQLQTTFILGSHPAHAY